MKKALYFLLCVVGVFTFSFGAFAGFTAYGDVTGDMKVNSSDALYVLMASVGLKSLDVAENRSADVDGNGTVNSTDALIILNFNVGKISGFPVEENAGDPDIGHDRY